MAKFNISIGFDPKQLGELLKSKYQNIGKIIEKQFPNLDPMWYRAINKDTIQKIANIAQKYTEVSAYQSGNEGDHSSTFMKALNVGIQSLIPAIAKYNPKKALGNLSSYIIGTARNEMGRVLRKNKLMDPGKTRMINAELAKSGPIGNAAKKQYNSKVPNSGQFLNDAIQAVGGQVKNLSDQTNGFSNPKNKAIVSANQSKLQTMYDMNDILEMPETGFRNSKNNKNKPYLVTNAPNIFPPEQLMFPNSNTIAKKMPVEGKPLAFSYDDKDKTTNITGKPEEDKDALWDLIADKKKKGGW